MQLEELKVVMREATGLMRVYPDPKGTGAKADEPMVMPTASTVEDLARMIHKDLAQRLKRARVWGTSAKFPGQQVGKTHVLADMDVVTLYSGK